MFAPFSTLSSYSLRTSEGDLSITDLAFSPETGEMTHVICDRRRLLFGAEMSVPVASLGTLDPRDKVWSADITADVPDETSEAHDPQAEPTSIPLEALPGTIVGPFGTTQSPILLAAQWLQLSGRGGDVRDGVDLPDQVERMEDWLGCVVFGPTGPIGSIADFHLDTTARRVRELSLRVGQEIHRVLFGAVRNFVSNEGYAVTDLTADDVENGLTVASAGPPLPDAPREPWMATAR